MRWSVELGRVAGIRVRMHLTFLLLLAWIGIGHYLVGGGAAAVRGLVFIALVFGSVLLHEFGHALTARRFGIRTPDITLLPIGGLARLERLPDKPREELLVALAGPLVNVGIAVALYAWLAATGRPGAAAGAGLFGGSLAARLLWVNVGLVLFNLIPAFPMDGGRVLRAALAARMDFTQATHIAASVGQAFAFLFVLVGFLVNPLLIFIAMFVYMGATAELSMAQLRDFAQCTPVASVMVTDFRSLHRDTPLAQAVELVVRGLQREFPVVDGQRRPVGMLCREDMIRALTQWGPQATVGEAMQSEVPVVRRSEMLSRVLPAMRQGRHTAVPVVDADGKLAGMLTRDHLAEIMMVQSALEDTRRFWWRETEGLARP